MAAQMGGLVNGVPESVLWLLDENGVLFLDEDGTPLIDEPPAVVPPVTVVGGMPILRDGFGGLKGFQRDIYEKTTVANVAYIAAGITLSGTTLTATFAELNFLWNGVLQTLTNVTATATLTSGQLTSSTWYLYVSRNYGFVLNLSTTLPTQLQTMNVAAIAVANSALTTQLTIQTCFGIRLFVNEGGTGTAVANLIPVSDQNGNMNS